MKVETMKLTPSIAESWLESITNDKQRKFRDHHALKLARAMSRGEWQTNNDMFMHGPDGLGNGQHRCAAVIKSKVPIDIVVAWNCTHDEIRRADQGGLKRGTSDALHYEGMQNTNNLAALINTIIRDCEKNRFAPSSEEAIKFARNNQEQLRSSLSYWNRCGGSRCPVEPSIVCAIHFIATQSGLPNEADRFAGAVADGVPQERGDAVWMLLKRFKDNKERISGRISRSLKCALAIKAFNYWIAGMKPPFLRFSPGRKEEWPSVGTIPTTKTNRK